MSPNLGTAKSPLVLNDGSFAYKRKGQWHYRNAETEKHFGRKFITVSDHDLIMALEARGYQVLNPAHECVDRPNLPCPACEKDKQIAKRPA